MVLPQIKTRTVTAVVLAAAFLTLLVGAHYLRAARYSLLTLLLVANMLCCAEFARFSATAVAQRIIAFVAVALPSIWMVLFQWPCLGCSMAASGEEILAHAALGLELSVIFCVLYFALISRLEISASADSFRTLFPAVALIGFGGACLAALPLLGGTLRPLLWFVLVVCINDIAAYFVGVSLGGPRIAPVFSPKKTFSGSAGGVVGGMAAGVLSGLFLLPELGMGPVSLYALCVAVAAQTGDLLKSYLKRVCNVKDSGAILPGHGGVLDRMDGLLLAAPVLCLLF